MNANNVIKATVDAGTKMTKAKLTDALRRTPEIEFYFVKDSHSKYAVVRIRMPD